MADTWYSRDLPVLTVLAPRLDQNPGDEITAGEIQVDELTFEDVDRAFSALVEGRYVTAKPMHDASSNHWLINGLTEKGRREAGLWPNPEALADRLLAALEQQIEATDDPDTRSRLQKLRDGARSLPREVLVSLAGSLGSGVILG